MIHASAERTVAPDGAAVAASQEYKVPMAAPQVNVAVRLSVKAGKKHGWRTCLLYLLRISPTHRGCRSTYAPTQSTYAEACLGWFPWVRRDCCDLGVLWGLLRNLHVHRSDSSDSFFGARQDRRRGSRAIQQPDGLPFAATQQ